VTVKNKSNFLRENSIVLREGIFYYVKIFEFHVKLSREKLQEKIRISREIVWDFT